MKTWIVLVLVALSRGAQGQPEIDWKAWNDYANKYVQTNWTRTAEFMIPWPPPTNVWMTNGWVMTNEPFPPTTPITIDFALAHALDKAKGWRTVEFRKVEEPELIPRRMNVGGSVRYVFEKPLTNEFILSWRRGETNRPFAVAELSPEGFVGEYPINWNDAYVATHALVWQTNEVVVEWHTTTIETQVVPPDQQNYVMHRAAGYHEVGNIFSNHVAVIQWNGREFREVLEHTATGATTNRVTWK